MRGERGGPAQLVDHEAVCGDYGWPSCTSGECRPSLGAVANRSGLPSGGVAWTTRRVKCRLCLQRHRRLGLCGASSRSSSGARAVVSAG
eukprot:67147-Heterocapsa_arctica.AAC.2